MTSRHKMPYILAITIGLLLPAINISFAGDEKASDSVQVDTAKVIVAKAGPLPKLIDLGSKGCIPCKKMAPILEEMKAKYEGKAEVVFIDVKEDHEAALKHKVTLIPTQIFFDTTGAEVYRHIGFFPADSIMAHFKALGAEL